MLLAACGMRGTLDCNRTDDRCVLTSGSLLMSNTKTFVLSSLRGARVVDKVERTGDGDEVHVAHLVVVTRGGELRFNEMESLASEPSEAVAGRINAFVADPRQAALHAAQDSRIKFFLMTGVVFWGMPVTLGVLLLLASLRRWLSTIRS
jgi:hypothetical protein